MAPRESQLVKNRVSQGRYEALESQCRAIQGLTMGGHLYWPL